MIETYETVYDVVYTCSDDDHATLTVGVSSGHAAGTNVGGDKSLVECVCVWVVNVVVNTCLVVETCWLPELLNISIVVIVVQEKL